MKRALTGFVMGVVLGSVTTGWAGFFYTSDRLVRLRDAACGDTLALGYVAGVYDLMAGLYPVVTSHNLGAIYEAAAREFASAPRGAAEGAPAAWSVVEALVKHGVITHEDALRILPARGLERSKSN
jgi:hypothetical protein